MGRSNVDLFICCHARHVLVYHEPLTLMKYTLYQHDQNRSTDLRIYDAMRDDWIWHQEGVSRRQCSYERETPKHRTVKHSSEGRAANVLTILFLFIIGIKSLRPVIRG